MRKHFIITFFALLLFTVISESSAQQQETAQALNIERVREIQTALQEAGLDGWLFYDFRGSDPLAPRILKLEQRGISTRRWFYFVPASGEPTKIVHSIERGKLDQLPGKKLVYLPWQQLHAFLRETITGTRTQRRVTRGRSRARSRTIAMQYSPENSIPYISRVDAGTIELLRSFGVNIASSADLVQRFEATMTPAQFETHREAADKIHLIIMESFSEIARRIRANEATTEYDIQQFMVRRFEEENLTSQDDPPIVAVNANSANPHYQPSREINSPIKRGDFVLFDVWGKLKTPGAIYADQTWTGYVGESVPAEYTRIFNIVRGARDAALEFVQRNVRAGKSIRGADVDDVARNLIRNAGYGSQFLHRTGHSIGEEVHGNGAHIDNLETRDARRIIPHTCFSIEPGIYLEGRFGIRSEIDVYVSERDAIATGAPIQTEIVAILAKE